MAKGKKTGGRDFKLGNKANPRGGGAVSKTTRVLRKITTDHIEDVAEVILEGNIEKLSTLARDPNSSVLKVWLAKAAAEGIKKGDIYPLEMILSRVLGRPRQTLEHITDEAPVQITFNTKFRKIDKAGGNGEDPSSDA